MVIKMTVVTEVVIMTSFSKNTLTTLTTLTTDQLSGQLFATLVMFRIYLAILANMHDKISKFVVKMLLVTVF